MNSYITTLNTFINGGRKHAVESRKTDAGKVLKNKQGADEVRYNDITIPPQAETIRNLHPFPIAPFPNTNDHLAGLAQTLLRKRLEPTEEKWVEDRLSKALEFAAVPPEWGIEPRKPTEEDDKDSDNEADDDQPSMLHRFNKRAKGTLNEEQLVQRWNSAHMWFFNPPQTSFDDEEYASGEEGEEGDEEEGETPFEDAMNTPAGDVSGQPAQEEATKSARPPPPVVMVQEAEPPVHKPVPGMPVLELGLIQKFMATGQL